MNKKAYLGSLIGTFIGIIIISIIGITIYPQIQEITLNMTNTTSFSSNISGGFDEVFNSSSTILSLLPLMFALGLAVISISLLMNTFNRVGDGFGGSSDEEEENEEYQYSGSSGGEFKKEIIEEPKEEVIPKKEEYDKNKFEGKSKYD